VLEEKVIELADANKREELAAVLAARVPVDPALAFEFLAVRQEKLAALLCRAAGLSANANSAVLRMRCRELRTNTAAAPILLHAYRDVAKLSPAELAALLPADSGARQLA
jgi:hypothetical protein